jgi:hypothetical protein
MNLFFLIQQYVTHLCVFQRLIAAARAVLFRAGIAFVDRKTYRQNTNFKTSQITIQQRLLYGKQISNKFFKIPKNFFDAVSPAMKNPGIATLFQKNKWADIQRFSAAIL